MDKLRIRGVIRANAIALAGALGCPFGGDSGAVGLAGAEGAAGCLMRTEIANFSNKLPKRLSMSSGTLGKFGLKFSKDTASMAIGCVMGKKVLS